ncbi:hypothetical protein SMA36_23180 [Escherichia coli]|uniref:hypothetical protein n=1 Tax=Enterobacteriaceae TaxID=543 RepID=UPI001D11545D|nr:hypothetical protein [Klebsiella pneumoniae]MDW6223059.1 hypothetical protein [Escherichia coli]
MGSCAAPSAKGDDKFITTDYLQQCQITDMNAQIATAVEQQGAVSEDINRSIINIRDAADTNVQTGQNNLQSAKSVAQLTSALSELAKQFWEKRG